MNSLFKGTEWKRGKGWVFYAFYREEKAFKKSEIFLFYPPISVPMMRLGNQVKRMIEKGKWKGVATLPDNEKLTKNNWTIGH